MSRLVRVVSVFVAVVLLGVSTAVRASALVTTTLQDWVTRPASAPTGSTVGGNVTVLTGSSKVARTVQVQKDDYGIWRTVATLTTTSSGAATIALPVVEGTVSFRLYVPATASASAAYSGARKVTGLFRGAVGTVNPATVGPPPNDLFTDRSGRLVALTFNNESASFRLDTLDSSTGATTSTRTIAVTGWPFWGTVHHGADGHHYVLLGRPNYNQVDSQATVAVRRYDANWNLTGIAQIGQHWGGMTFFFSVGDFNGDGRGDIIGVRGGDGTMWLYPGRTDGKLDYGRQVGRGWGSFRQAFSPGDFSGDGRFDLVGVDANGVLWGYNNTGKGGWSTYRQMGSGFRGYRLLA